MSFQQPVRSIKINISDLRGQRKLRILTKNGQKIAKMTFPRAIVLCKKMAYSIMQENFPQSVISIEFKTSDFGG